MLTKLGEFERTEIGEEIIVLDESNALTIIKNTNITGSDPTNPVDVEFNVKIVLNDFSENKKSVLYDGILKNCYYINCWIKESKLYALGDNIFYTIENGKVTNTDIFNKFYPPLGDAYPNINISNDKTYISYSKFENEKYYLYLKKLFADEKEEKIGNYYFLAFSSKSDKVLIRSDDYKYFIYDIQTKNIVEQNITGQYYFAKFKYDDSLIFLYDDTPGLGVENMCYYDINAKTVKEHETIKPFIKTFVLNNHLDIYYEDADSNQKMRYDCKAEKSYIIDTDIDIEFSFLTDRYVLAVRNNKWVIYRFAECA